MTTSCRGIQVALTVAYSFNISWNAVYTPQSISHTLHVVSSFHSPWHQSSLHFPIHPLSLRITPSVQSVWRQKFTPYRVYTVLNIQFPFPMTSGLQLPLHAVSTSFDICVSLHNVFHSTRQPVFVTHENQFLFPMTSSIHSLWHPVLTARAI